MIDLSALTPAELAQVDAAFGLMLNALDMLQEYGVISEDGVNLTQLYDAVTDEKQRRQRRPVPARQVMSVQIEARS